MAKQKSGSRKKNQDNPDANPVKDFEIREAFAKPETHKESRVNERAVADLETIVQRRLENNESWKEITTVTTISRGGAGFTISRECQVGCLLALVLPLPAELRAYDLSDKLYPVMGLVQYCHESTVNGQIGYRVGVAFIGKHVPESYKDNPLQQYRVCGTTATGLWKVTESDVAFKPRKSARFPFSLDVRISMIRKENRSAYSEETITKNISSTGASVESSLEVDIGDRIKFACKQHDFYTIAIVRNRKEIPNRPSILNLEFVDTKFPVEKIATVQIGDMEVV